MGPSQVIAGTETDPSRYTKTSLGSVGFSPAPGWKYLVTLDEAWFYFSNQHEQIWLPDQEGPPTIQRQTISTPKTMLTVVWNPHGFHLVSLLPKGQK
jgi:hypothetical protein